MDASSKAFRAIAEMVNSRTEGLILVALRGREPESFPAGSVKVEGNMMVVGGERFIDVAEIADVEFLAEKRGRPFVVRGQTL